MAEGDERLRTVLDAYAQAQLRDALAASLCANMTFAGMSQKPAGR